MIIKKINGEVTRSVRNVTTYIEVNGKSIRIYDFDVQTENGQSDSGREIDDIDLQTLSELEAEILGDNLNDIMDMKDGETYKEEKEECPNCGFVTVPSEIDYVGDQTYRCPNCK